MIAWFVFNIKEYRLMINTVAKTNRSLTQKKSTAEENQNFEIGVRLNQTCHCQHLPPNNSSVHKGFLEFYITWVCDLSGLWCMVHPTQQIRGTLLQAAV